MWVFGMSDRGKFRSVSVDTAKGSGIQITMPGGAHPVGASSLVTSFGVEQRENFSVAQCLNGGIHLYTFGHDPNGSQFSLGVTSFLNTCSGSYAADLAQALSAYSGGRVSQSRSEASMSIGNAVVRGYLVGQSIRSVDAELGLVEASYTFIALDPQGGSKGKGKA